MALGFALTTTSFLALNAAADAQEVNRTSGTTNLNALASYPDFNGVRSINAGTLITGSGVTLILQNYQYGAFAQNGSRIELSNVIVFTNAYSLGAPGPRGFAAQGAGAVVIVDGFDMQLSNPASTAAQNGTGLRAVNGGLVDASNGSVRMTGPFNYAALAVNGTVNADNVSMETNGTNSYGVFVFPGNAPSLVSITGASTVTTRGLNSHGLLSQPEFSTLPDGTSTIRSSAVIQTFGSGAVGAFSAQGGWIDLTSGSVTTNGVSSNGISSTGERSKVWIRDPFTSVTTRGNTSHGLSVARSGAVTGAGGTILLDSVDIETSGSSSNGINARPGGRILPLSGADPSSAPGDTVVIFNGSIAASGASSNGIYAEADNALFVETGAGSSVTGDARGISAVSTGSGVTNVTTRGAVSGGAMGVGLSGSQAANVTNEASGTIRNNSGQSADRAIERVAASGTNGPTNIVNRGLVMGTMFFLEGDDSVQNAGTWNMAGGTSDFGAGVNGIANLSGGLFIAANDSAAAETTQILNIGAFGNAGEIRLADGAAGDRLVINGNYTGTNGLITLDAALGNDGSPTDMLVISGDASGSGSIRVTNAGGTGAPTTNGIKIVDIGGASDAAFTLLGDYVYEGDPAIIAGAYAYRLYKNGVSTPTDGDWYLRSALTGPGPSPPNPPTPPGPPTPLYQPGTPIYEIYPQILLGLNELPTMQQRLGNRYWSGGGTGIVSEGADAVGEAPEEEGPARPDASRGIWMKVDGSHVSIDPRLSTTTSAYDYDIYRLQAGLDAPLFERPDGVLIGGVTVHYGHAEADISSRFGDGGIEADAYGFGGTLTWQGVNGFYVDAQAKVSWFDSDLTSNSVGPLAESNDGFGYALSLETGKRIALSDGWSVTPQGQIIYSAVDFDDFTQLSGGPLVPSVSPVDGDSLRGRLGVSLDRESSWQAENGTLSRSHIYGIANLYYEFLDGTAVDVSGTAISSRGDRFWGGLGAGASYNWNDDKYALYAEGLANTSLENFGDSYEFKGTLGFKVQF